MNTAPQISKFLFFLKSFFGRGIHFVYNLFIAPKSELEDAKRQEFILNTILAVIIPLLVILDVFVDIATHEEGAAYRGIPFFIFTAIVLGFVWLLFISRRGYYKDFFDNPPCGVLYCYNIRCAALGR